MMTFGIGNSYFRKLMDGGHGDDLQEELAYEYNINLKNGATILASLTRFKKKKPRLAAGLIFLSPTNDYVLL